MAAKIETMENDKKQYIVITFGNEQYGIDISCLLYTSDAADEL